MWIDDFTRKHREGVLYLVCGAGTVLVSWLSYIIFVWLGLEINISNILSWVCAVSFAFVVNKWIVFLSRSTEKKTLVREVSSFFLMRILTGLVAIGSFPILYDIGLNQSLFGIDGLVTKITVSIIEIVLNYVTSKYIVFKNNP
ncbi:MAG: GtrA family protein [Candidatus Methanoplasma sp.]|jgi:putative flippase GtrA|nr:GtrA family protein [Candidatus Methanoplasma sp.]